MYILFSTAVARKEYFSMFYKQLATLLKKQHLYKHTCI